MRWNWWNHNCFVLDCSSVSVSTFSDLLSIRHLRSSLRQVFFMAIGCWIAQGIPEKSCGWRGECDVSCFIQWAVGWRAVPDYYVRDRSSGRRRNRHHPSFTPKMFDMFCLGKNSSSENCCQISLRHPLDSPLKAWDCLVSLPFSRSSPCYLRASWTRRCLVIRFGRSQSISIASLCFWVNLSYCSSGFPSKKTPFSHAGAAWLSFDP